MIKPVTIKQLSVQGVLENIDSPETINNIKRAVILAGSRSLLESIKQSVMSNVPKATVPNVKYKDVLLDAVLISKEKQDGSRIVHAYGLRDSKSGTYRLRFFNKDTKDRYQKTYNGKKLKKKRFLGHITGTDFFNKGYQTGKSQALESMKNAIKNILDNING